MPSKRNRAGAARRRVAFGPSVVMLEGRALLAPVNVLVNNPAEDATNQDTQSETSVLAFTGAGGRPIVLDVFNDSGSDLNSSNHFTGYARSTDGGATFTDLGTLPTSAAGDAGDPVLARDNVSGRIYFSTLGFSNGNVIQVFRSDNDGLTFQAPVNAAPGRASLDKEWITVDNAPGGGQGTVYLVARDFGTGNGIYLFKSTDGGATWGPGGGVLIASGAANNVQGANVVVGPDHAVYVSYFNQSSPEKIMIRKSTNGGTSFGAAATITNLSLTSTNGDQGLSPGFRSDAFPQVAVNPNNPSILYAVYPDKGVAAGDKGDIFFSESTDGGATWGSRVRVNDDAGANDQYMPTLAVTPDGTKVGVFWYDRRNDPANNLIDYFGAIGTISGTTVTFAPNYRVGDVSFPPAFGQDPVVNSVYMGDYDEMAADNNVFYLSHVDNRLPSLHHSGNQQDVRLAEVSTGAVGPEVINTSLPGTIFPGLGTIRVTFNEPIYLRTIHATDFTITGPNGLVVPVTAVTPVVGSRDTQFDVSFSPLTAIGNYTIVVGPGGITDRRANPMDNNLDGIPGDPSVSNFTVSGARIIASTPSSTLPGIGDVKVTFNEPMDPSTFTPSDVVLTGPGGSIAVSGVAPIAGSNNTQYDITFPPQTAPGSYRAVIGPDIRDPFGNPMDQNNNGIPGEVPGDQFTATITVSGPRIIASSPTGALSAPIGDVKVTFNEPMDPSTFTPSDVVLTGPGGSIAVGGVAPIAGSNNTQYDITFPPQSALGSYRAVIGPDIPTSATRCRCCSGPSGCRTGRGCRDQNNATRSATRWTRTTTASRGRSPATSSRSISRSSGSSTIRPRPCPRTSSSWRATRAPSPSSPPATTRRPRSTSARTPSPSTTARTPAPTSSSSTRTA